MRRFATMSFVTVAGLGALLFALPAPAALPVGASAPDFATIGALNGKDFGVRLSERLRHGPVVLYFYPKQGTPGCTMEAHAFSEAMPEFRKLGASVIGMSADKLADLRGFSVEDCRGQFPVAVASKRIIRDYRVPLAIAGVGTGRTKRTTYVIAPDGHVAMVWDAMDWKEHVPRALAAVRALAVAR